MPLVFRLDSNDRWRRASTQSISDQTLTFVTRAKIAIGTPVQVRFVVRVTSARSEVECWTRIVRVRKSANAEALVYTAAIESHEFVKVRA
ncbi:MAG TPA: hypothetical protein VJ691_16050 [Vicinamibacterales bacterium]|nr:hypothetical protein [Vicinamibacterales bacterium]